MAEVQVREYLDSAGRSPFGNWFAGLNAVAAAKIAVTITRLASGNFSNVKGVGSGVFEYKLDFGPGYRFISERTAPGLVILLGGSSKKGQGHAIAAARVLWDAYKKAKAGKDDAIWR